MRRTAWVLHFYLFTGLALCMAQQSSPVVPVASGYVLGPNDQIAVSVVELPEFGGRPYRVDEDGTISLPLVGRVHAAGMTLAQLEGTLTSALQSQVKVPHISTNVVEARLQPVSVMGAVNTPGTQQIQGPKTLFDVIAAAGGLKPEAGEVVTITRHESEGSMNLPNEVRDAGTARSTAELRVRDIVDLRDPRSNILVRAHDEISVSRSQLLYVLGNVHKPGGFTLTQGRPVSALEALSLAEGFAINAAPSGSRILRKGAEFDTREQIPVDLKKILAGKMKDVRMYPEDILYVPDNTSRRVAVKILETALTTISGVIVWRGL